MSHTIDTWYGTISAELMSKLADIRLLICDVDGVLSDGKIYMGNQGEELKTFHTHDGFGIKALLNQQIEVAVITGRNSRIVSDRMKTLGVKYVYQGQGEKLPAFQEILSALNLDPSHVAYMGDDVIDLPVMNAAGLGIAVANAHPKVRLDASYITMTPGGEGAVREVCDLILQAQGHLDSAKGTSV